MTGAALAVLLLAAPARALHVYPIEPVEVVLRVEPDRVLAEVDMDSVYWIEEVTEVHPLPPRSWPPEALDKAAKYLAAHLRLSADGTPLAGRILDASYVQRPWEVNENGRVHLRVAYPPVADGAALAGTADFFDEYRRERLEEHEPLLPAMDFRTRVSVPGRTVRAFELKPGAWSFSVPAAEARRTAPARLAESAATGAAVALGAIEGWGALAALALSLAPGLPSARRAAGALAAAALGAALPLPAPAPLAWAAGAAASAAAGRWRGGAAVPALEALAAAALGRAWAAEAMTLLPRAAPGAFERVPALAGALAAGALLTAAGAAAATAGRRALDAHSASRAGELFERRRRLAATVLLIVSGVGAAASLPGGAWTR